MSGRKMGTGELIRCARERAGLSQGDLAERCGWPRAQGRVSQYETGVTPINIENLGKIAAALDLKVTDMLSDAHTPPKPKVVTISEALANKILKLTKAERKAITLLVDRIIRIKLQERSIGTDDEGQR